MKKKKNKSTRRKTRTKAEIKKIHAQELARKSSVNLDDLADLIEKFEEQLKDLEELTEEIANSPDLPEELEDTSNPCEIGKIHA